MEFNIISNKWQGIFKFDLTGNGKDTTITGYVWNSVSNAWDFNNKDEYSFDDDGRRVLEANYLWNKPINNWQLEQKWETTYNDNTATMVFHCFNHTTSAWETSSKRITTKSNDGKQKTTIFYNWNKTNNSWEEYSKEETQYNSQGKITSIKSYKWNGTTWVEEGEKFDYSYDANSRVLSDIHWFSNNAGIKSVFTYDRKGNNLEKTYYSWDENTSSWYANSKYEYTYDNNYNLTHVLYSYSENISKPLTVYGKYVYSYNSHNAKVYSVNYYWDASSSSFLKSSSNIYFNSPNYVTKVRNIYDDNIQNKNAQIENRVNEAVVKGMRPEKAFEIYAK